MKSILNLLRKRWLIAVLVVIIVFLYFLIFVSDKSTSPTTQQITPGELIGVSYTDITPGLSTKNEVLDKLNEPINVKYQKNFEIFEFSTTSEYRNDEIYFENERVVFIKEMVNYGDDKTADDIKEKYGEPLYVLYDKNSPNSSFYLNVYPKEGLAYLGHPDGTLLEVWYFQPEDIDSLLNSWASEYSSTRPIIQQN